MGFTIQVQRGHVERTVQAMPIAPKKIRVCAYCRVSTKEDDQLNSYAAQVDYYTGYIGSKSEWEFVGIYADEGITGTKLRRRKDFNRMIADALDGKIDLIIVKSVSRFARKQADTNVQTLFIPKRHGLSSYQRQKKANYTQ